MPSGDYPKCGYHNNLS